MTDEYRLVLRQDNSVEIYRGNERLTNPDIDELYSTIEPTRKYLEVPRIFDEINFGGILPLI